MNRTILLFVLIGLVSCGSALKTDPVIPAIVAGYPTLEFEACGKTWHGLGVCALNQGEEYDSVNFYLQGYYKGTGRVVSTNCGIDWSFTYGENQKIKISIPGNANQSCLFSVTLSPEYPRQSSSGISVYSLRGHLAIKVKDSEPWHGDVRRMTGEWKSTLRLGLEGEGPVRVVIRGCGIAYEREHEVQAGFISLELADAVNRAEKGLCVLEGVVIDPEFEDYLFTVVVAQYANQLPNDPEWRNFRFSPLAIPMVRVNKDKLEIEAADVVSVLSLDGEYKLDRKKSFKFDQTKPHTVRAVTVKGRSVLGFWNPTKKEFLWMQ